ncbi:putative dynein assembly factor 1, axonemal-like [Trypanosoma grayi]|uniref:putative dynein assembly factor 1, axonemal-like n=1 Tax=Trypanosoma grayi TaxID=71804 RepID=UPI0004F4722E|nr:putative dynein assembly factor 1, axonemal-like [Trypanosoma grayi]KEG09049.1 putative dynein assembly factor 1, axonemal-like [Trypanosoma grayi]
MAAAATEGVTMTEEAIIQQCKMHKGYSTPELNEKLYLHHIGFTSISSLNAFNRCTVLYLNNNAIDNLEGLHPLHELRALYLGNNAIQDCLSLPMLPALQLLDISCNSIGGFEGLLNAPGLETLLASRNRIQNLKGLEPLERLMTIDVSYNSIAQPGSILPHLFQKETLRTCVLHGNRFLESVPQYRKTLIARMPSLRFLDQLPVFPEERSCAEAFAKGGAEAEAAQRQENNRQEDEEKQKQFLFYGEARRLARGGRCPNEAGTAPTRYFEDNDYEGVFLPAQ